MLLFDFRAIENKLLVVRKRIEMTQAEVAETVELSDRTYVDIERGTINMRIEIFLRICQVLHITPDEILTENLTPEIIQQELLWKRLNTCNPKDKETAFRLLNVSLQSLN